MRFLLAAGALAASFLGRRAAAYPHVEKIYGVNIGSWLLVEPWMLPKEWEEMGAQRNCTDCWADCINSEFAMVEAYPDTADAKFQKHWETWFTQTDVDQLVDAGINVARIPLGYWIVERLVDRETEFFPRGGIKELQRGLKQLKDAGIAVILDHHALPGQQSSMQMFAGRCTTDIQFYTPYNYQRALIWTAVMTALSHLDPNFESVYSIHAVNEPMMDSSVTPGYGEFQKNFVKTIRAVELAFGIGEPSLDIDINVDLDLHLSASNITAALTTTVSNLLNLEVKAAVLASIPILVELSEELGFNLDPRSIPEAQKEPLVANLMDAGWQNYPADANPADAAIGQTSYDNHLYYSFGGVADDNELAYMIHICNLDRVEKARAAGNTPLFFGEWSLATQWINATDEFLKQWADAQKYAYGQDQGWIFWNFKLELSEFTQHYFNRPRFWSYFEGLRRGYLTKDPAAFHNPDVCEPYIGQIYTPPATTSTSATESASESVSVTVTETTIEATPTEAPATETASSSEAVSTSTEEPITETATATEADTVVPEPTEEGVNVSVGVSSRALRRSRRHAGNRH